LPREDQDASVASRLIYTALSARDTGQFIFVTSEIFWKAASSMPATSETTVRSIAVIVHAPSTWSR
jgi:hypothetical protein